MAHQTLRSRSSLDAIDDLLTKVDAGRFVDTFGVATTEAAPLVKAKTLTIAKLVELCPAGTADPTPYIYNSTLYSLAGLAAVATAAQLTIRPVNPKFYETPAPAASSGPVVDVQSKEVGTETAAKKA